MVTLDRMAKMLACAALPACAFASMPVKAQEPVQALSATSNWIVDWGATYCTLARKFGSEGDPFLLRMHSYQQGYDFEVYLSGKAIRHFQNRGALKIAFGHNEPIVIHSPQSVDDGAFGPGIIFSTSIRKGREDEEEEESEERTPRSLSNYPDTAFEAGLDGVTLSAGKRQVVLVTGPMRGALAALRKCTDDLVKQWDLDPAVQATLLRPTSPVDFRSLVRSIRAVYPSTQARQGKQARVNVHVLVDADGRVTACTIPESYNDPAFDELACKKIRAVRFEPALDANGTPVASYWNTSVIYHLK
jgi:TonB family protein